MINLIKNYIKKLFFGVQLNEKTYIDYLKKKGIKIGKNFRVFSPRETTIDVQNPYMLEIGDNVRITKGVKILTHDYSWSVLAGKYDEVLGNVGYVEIGNNVFIGIDSIILKNTIIEDNVIIGAGSIVKGLIRSNGVYAGNPAKRIMELDEFYKKRKQNQQKELNMIEEKFKLRFNKFPTLTDYPIEYFHSLKPYNILPLNIEVDSLIKRTGNYQKIKNKLEKEINYKTSNGGGE